MSGPSGLREILAQVDLLAKTSGPQVALEHVAKLLQRHPGFELWVTAAGLALRLERLPLACSWLEQAHALRPDFAPVRRQLSQVLNRLATDASVLPAGQSSTALLQRALELWPDNAAARFNLAQALLDAQPQTTLQLAGELLQHEPVDLDAASLLATAASALGKSPLVMSVAPRLLTAHRMDLVRRCARQLAWNGGPGAARPLQQRLHDVDPSDAMAVLARELALPACYCSTDELEQARARYREGLTELPELLAPRALRQRGCALDQLSWSNFLLAYQGRDDQLLQARYGDWLTAATSALAPLADPRANPRRPGPLRIGLLSSFWRHCTVGAYFGAWVAALRGPDSVVTLITLGGHVDDWTLALQAQADQTLRLPDALASAAQQVAALDLDLLVYPELGMHGATLVLAALRLARQQWCGWGHPVSSGLPTIDRQISVDSMEPMDAAAHYRESLLLLPGLGTRYASPALPLRVARGEFGLADDRLLIALPSSAFKLHPDGDAELAGLLAARPHAQAVLLNTEPAGAMQRLRTRFEGALQAAGADAARQLAWLPAQPRDRFLALLGCCDVLLDPWHWSGGNTTLDALHMGLPILTRWGAFMRGRQSAAMLQQLGIEVGMAHQHALLDDADARQHWRQQVALGLPQLLDGAAALQTLRDAVQTQLQP